MNNKTMVQQVMTSPGKIVFENKEIPSYNENQVLLRIRRIGICGSDIHVSHGEHPFTSYPVTQGHEVSGEVVEIGKNITTLSVGDKVLIEPQVVCGECHPCRNGKYNLCEKLKVMGFQTTGAASEYFVVDEKNATKVPSTMTFDQAAMLEPVAVGVHAVNRFKNIEGSKVVVLGCGPIGILLAMVCKAMGAKEVLITDIVDYRLNLAKSCGIDYAVNTKEKSLDEAVLNHFGKDRADVIFDCAGNNITMGQAISTARKGSTIILVAVFAGMANIDLAVLNDHELTLDSTMMYRHEDFLKAIELVDSGKIKLEPLMSKHFKFKEYSDAYQYIADNPEQTMKVLIDVDR